MKQLDAMMMNVMMFKLTNPPMPYDSLCAEEKTLNRLMNHLLKDAHVVTETTGNELFGMKIYVDEECPIDKVRFKLKGVTVAEVYAFEPHNPERRMYDKN